MPKRIIDGEGMWRSSKIKKVQPESYRQEYAWLLPLALANGVFEADPDAVWATAYAFLRPSITPEIVSKIFEEFERVGLLIRWTHTDGKVWGWWVGIDKPGRLPKPSDLREKKYEIGPNVPNDLKPGALKSPQQGAISAHGTGVGVGSGLDSGSGNGNGKGLGLGSGSGAVEKREAVETSNTSPLDFVTPENQNLSPRKKKEIQDRKLLQDLAKDWRETHRREIDYKALLVISEKARLDFEYAQRLLSGAV